jgi:hypothetical protein
MTQTARILSHLKVGPITPLQALECYGCFRLAARIAELRDQGYNIHTERVTTGEKTYARYHLAVDSKSRQA